MVTLLKLSVLMSIIMVLTSWGYCEKSNEVIHMKCSAQCQMQNKPPPQKESYLNIIIVTMVIFFLSTLKVGREHEKNMGVKVLSRIMQ